MNGTCLCGQCKVELGETFDKDGMAICHCTDCQQTSGSAFSVNVLAEQSQTKISGPVKTYSAKVPSGNTVDRIFCGNCGSALSHKSKAFGDKQAVQMGNFGAAKKLPIKMELFTKSRWEHIAPFEDVAAFSGMPE